MLYFCIYTFYTIIYYHFIEQGITCTSSIMIFKSRTNIFYPVYQFTLSYWNKLAYKTNFFFFDNSDVL